MGGMKTGYKAPGKHYRTGISLLDLGRMFPDEESARVWFEGQIWGDERHCPRCDGTRTSEASHPTMPYWCTPCRKYFSVKTGTVLESSKVPLQKWVWAIYLCATSLKGVSSMKLHRDLGVPQNTAWFMLQRIRESWSVFSAGVAFAGPVEVDETYIGGLERNKHAHKKANLGRGPVGKTAVVGAKDRESNQVAAAVVDRTDRPTLQGFARAHMADGAEVFTDEAKAYQGLPNHETVRHSVSEYVNGKAHTNGVESFWAMLKRGYHGTYHQMSPKHLQRYVNEFAGRHNLRDLDTIDQMRLLAAGMVGRRLLYRNLTA